MPFTLETLDTLLAGRAGAAPEESYTARLLAQGAPECARKLGEEAVETVIAALGGDEDALAAESADLLYHLLVLLRARGVTLATVMAELERRTGQSGLAEKAGRAERAR